MQIKPKLTVLQKYTGEVVTSSAAKSRLAALNIADYLNYQPKSQA